MKTFKKFLIEKNNSKIYYSNIEQDTTENTYFRKVEWTGEYMQLVIMNIKPGEDIGEETHQYTDQFIRVESGNCQVIIDDQEIQVKEDEAFIIPAGSKHNIINNSTEDLKLYSIYAPAEHEPDTLQKNKGI